MQTIPTNETDQELYNKFLAGEKEAFNEIIKKIQATANIFYKKI